jgi:2,3-bisphosphoglycerate-independent phosphoglycerate mutase
METPHVTLVICDGMGLSPEVNGNAILQAKTPTLDYLLANYPSMRLLASGTEVGLDMGEPGNSEVGHLTLGTGQVLPQAFQIINGSIKSEEYKKNKVFLEGLEKAKSGDATLHIVGIVSSGGVHGHIDHIIAMLELAKEKGVKKVAIHAITDGRDSPPKVALDDIKKLAKLLEKFESGVIATVGGRFYAMDRDKTWERTDAFYWAMLGKSKFTSATVEEAINAGYKRGESDENLQPTIITGQGGEAIAPVKDNDVLLFTNYRPDRIRQLATRVISGKQSIFIMTMTDYFLGDVPEVGKAGTKALDAFPLPKPKGTLSEALEEHHKSQLHLAETEKYAHVTYFFNGHEEKKHAKEEWLLVPSAKVDSFDRVPEMSAKPITAAYISSRKNHPADLTVVNYANMDMVGHTGNFKATIQAVEFVDEQLKIVLDSIEKEKSWMLITADHGNAEQKINPITNEIDKEHTTNPVPFILVHIDVKKGRGMDKSQLAVMSQVGMLADVSPTILELMDIRKPAQMAGASLVKQLIDK